jgi:hypothetical protein
MLARAKTLKRVERISAFMRRGVGREDDEVLQVEPDADLLADGVVVVALHQAEKGGATGQAQGVAVLGAAKGSPRLLHPQESSATDAVCRLAASYATQASRPCSPRALGSTPATAGPDAG